MLLTRKRQIEFSLILLILLNWVYVFKYGIRYFEVFEVALVAFFYAGLVVALVARFPKKFKPDQTLENRIFYGLVVLFFAVTIYINVKIDALALQIDRWSAMTEGITAILNGTYPYSALDHLGGRTSNLPTLFLIGLPFYLLGDVGILQSFTFLIFTGIIYKLIKSPAIRIVSLLLLISSFWYLYEIVVKSDLVSNTILVLASLVYLFKILNKEGLKKAILLGVLIAILVFTRLVFALPLGILFALPFAKASLSERFKFLLGFFTAAICLGALVFYTCPSLEVFYAENPFTLQNRQLPLWLSLLLAGLAIYFLSRLETVEQLIRNSFVALALPVVVAFFIIVKDAGFEGAIIDSHFDITYFNLFTPFLVLYLSLQLDARCVDDHAQKNPLQV
ncbi:hypothetical protein [Leeuwenhoekiella sp. NPDC079379]|uniref:hypothetical protein n=1 Tax=Leeuwenhoekiella sp. NPDC079379 TaxID=3364122 RepID=UPI0037CAA2C6